MAKQKGEVTLKDTEDMFGDILDRIPSTVREHSDQARPSPPPQPEETDTIKVSLYLTPQEVNALDEQIIKRRQQTGKSPRRSHLIREAIELWLTQQA